MTMPISLLANFWANGKTFSDTEEHQHRQFMRAAVRRAKISKNKRDLVLALLNIWFKRKAEGLMYPGRKKLAKMAGISIRTAATILAEMREAGALEVICYGKGGRGKATRYRMNLTKLIVYLGFKLPKEVKGALGRVFVSDSQFRPWAVFKNRAKLAHGIVNNCAQDAWTGPEVPVPRIERSDLGWSA